MLIEESGLTQGTNGGPILLHKLWRCCKLEKESKFVLNALKAKCPVYLFKEVERTQ